MLRALLVQKSRSLIYYNYISSKTIIIYTSHSPVNFNGQAMLKFRLQKMRIFTNEKRL